MVLGAPIVFSDAERGSRIILCGPLFQARDESHLVVDPRFVHVIAVPKRTRRAIAAQLHGRCHIISKFTALRVVVNGEEVKQPLAGRIVRPAQLVEQPRQIICVPVRRAVRQIVPAVRAAPLLVVTAVKVTRPTPFLRAYDERVGVDGFHFRAVIENFIADLVHCRAGRMHVPVRRGPEARLVVHDVVAQAAGRGATPAIG